MTVGRAILVLILLAGLSAAALALVSRAPAAIRQADPGPDATDASNGAKFTSEQIARHGAYRGPAYLSVVLSVALQIASLWLLGRYIVPRFVPRFGAVPGGWLSMVILVTVLVVVAMTVVSLPSSYVRGLQMDRAWGLSTQTSGAWLADQGRGLLVGLVTAIVAAVVFFGLVRAFPRTWWLWGWAGFTLLTLLLTFLWPIVIAPLFNRFTPLEQGPLRDRVVSLAAEAGVDIDEVLVADASKRTTAENAYVAGVGSSKRMVLYDTLLDAGDTDQTAYVVAHELGHEVHSHIWKFVALSSASLVAAFAALWWLAERTDVWRWVGASGIGDVRALPLLVILTIVGGLLFLPVQNAVSRSFEKEADRVAISLTDDPDTAVKVYRRLAFSNLADLRPPRVAVWALFSHPPIPERIRNVLEPHRSD